KIRLRRKRNKTDENCQELQHVTGGTTSEDGQALVDSSNNDGVVDSSNNYEVVDSSTNDGVVGSSNGPFPFENLVFEGGGNKGLAYVGCLQYLEELNAMKHIRRVGGSSAGAITAALVALGYTSEEIEGFLSENVQEIFLDHSCGYLSLLPNLIRKFGWNPGKKIFKWFGDKIKNKSNTKNPDMTFLDLYKERNHMELCVVVTNITQMRTEYCHPKTTPDMPIRVALRMSMAIPGIFAARKYESHGQSDLYVDGGVLCNYPIHCFDGWYLSMQASDSFFARVDSPFNFMDKSSFEGVNKKTLGFLLFEDTEKELMRSTLEERVGSLEPERPDKLTKLFNVRLQFKAGQLISVRLQFEVGHLISIPLQFKIGHLISVRLQFKVGHLISVRLQFKENFSKFKPLLFGEDESVEMIFNTLDENHDGKISFAEFIHFCEKHGYSKTSGPQSYWRKDVKCVTDYLSAVQDTLLTNLKLVYFLAGDKNRTVGINTGHIGTSDYDLEEEDRKFIVERGKNSTKAFFEEYNQRAR
ncbi:unnamed protein product, partial [Lymnaea stagnalis]